MTDKDTIKQNIEAAKATLQEGDKIAVNPIQGSGIAHAHAISTFITDSAFEDSALSARNAAVDKCNEVKEPEIA